MSTDVVRDYFVRVGDRGILSKTDEVRLAHAVEVGVIARESYEHAAPSEEGDLKVLIALGETAFRHLVESNLRLVVSIARNYLDRGVPLADLIQDGNLGLLRAVQGFDHAKGFRFSTYATFWIKESIEQGITKQAHVIKIPHHQLRRLAALKKVYSEFVQLEGRSPSVQELADYASMDIRAVNALLLLERPTASLHQSLGGDGEVEFGDTLSDHGAEDPLERTIQHEERRAVRQAMSALAPAEVHLVLHTYGLLGHGDRPLRDVARDLAITGPAAARLLATTIDKLGADEELLSAIA